MTNLMHVSVVQASVLYQAAAWSVWFLFKKEFSLNTQATLIQ